MRMGFKSVIQTKLNQTEHFFKQIFGFLNASFELELFSYIKSHNKILWDVPVSVYTLSSNIRADAGVKHCFCTWI